MHTWIRLTGLTVLLISLGGCASGMSTDECVAADWRTIGFEDGTRGLSADQIGTHRKSCAKAGVTPDLAAYQEGHKSGLKTFCKPANGYRAGVDGRTYHGNCPHDMEPDFLDAYERGYELYALKADVRRMEREVDKTRNELNKTQRELDTVETRLSSGSYAGTDPNDLIQQVKDLAVDVQRLRSELGRKQGELSERQQRLAQYQRDNPPDF